MLEWGQVAQGAAVTGNGDQAAGKDVQVPASLCLSSLVADSPS